MGRESMKTLSAIKQCGEDMLTILVSGQVSADIYSQKTSSLANLINSIQSLLPAAIYQEYSDFFNSFSTFCNQCSNPDFLTVNVDSMASSLQLFTECMEDIIQRFLKESRVCPCCGKDVIYMPLSDYYRNMYQKLGINTTIKSETLR